MTYSTIQAQIDYLGELEPIRPARARAELDRRQVSMRWLSGSILTGIVSLTLMGGALYAALDGRQQLAIPAMAYQGDQQELDVPAVAVKGARPAIEASAAQDTADSRVMMVSTITREGDRDVVKLKPFLNVVSPLAVAPRKEYNYPPFDALAVFSESGEPEPVLKSGDLIYGADVEGEVSIQTEPYPYGSQKISLVSRQSPAEIEEMVRKAAPELNIGATALASISYFDPTRFSTEDTLLIASPGVTITAENMTVLSMQRRGEYEGVRYDERLARIRSNAPIKLALLGEGIGEDDSRTLTDALASNMASDEFVTGDQLRIVFEESGGDSEIRKAPARVSVYRGGSHLVSVTRRDNGSYVYSSEPDPLPQIERRDAGRPLIARSMPTVYDAIYRSMLNEGLTKKQASDLVRVFAFDVDFRSAISPKDEISVLMALEDGSEAPTENSEILYASIRLGDMERKYYRFLDTETGRVDFYDETGKSSKQFLLRQAVPNGQFRSPFGMRRHPVTGIYKMHTGVDWAAPRGSPIVAAGNGIVEKAGWAGGYGRQTVIRHTNGYETSYSHQSSFAKGIAPGVRVRQGQVIGFVGSTGLSTGPHLHYEVIVNGNKVDPMRIKLPRGKVFKGDQLRAFEAERDRINQLLKKREEESRRLAQL